MPCDNFWRSLRRTASPPWKKCLLFVSISYESEVERNLSCRWSFAQKKKRKCLDHKKRRNLHFQIVNLANLICSNFQRGCVLYLTRRHPKSCTHSVRCDTNPYELLRISRDVFTSCYSVKMICHAAFERWIRQWFATLYLPFLRSKMFLLQCGIHSKYK